MQQSVQRAPGCWAELQSGPGVWDVQGDRTEGPGLLQPEKEEAESSHCNPQLLNGGYNRGRDGLF